MKEILKKLNIIQTELKAPKGQMNKFGNYKYRSCEDILEGVKPILRELKCAIAISDKVVQVGERYYIEATATLYDCESAESFSNTASAREEESKKGMDSSQVTGATSSYARKYALNGLLAIDDTKDSDATNRHDKDDSPKREESPTQDQTYYEAVEGEPDFSEMAQNQITMVQAIALDKMIDRCGANKIKLMAAYKVATLEALTNEQWNDAQASLKRKYGQVEQIEKEMGKPKSLLQ